MKVLVIGGGGREHALAWKLAQSPRVSAVFVAPGNAGTAREPGVTNVALATHQDLVQFAREREVALTVVGPEAPLAAGIVDAFQAAGLRIFGPAQDAAQLESSKDFAKAFMQRHGIPTAAYRTFTDAGEARAYLRERGAPIVVKADGLAAGKGVVVAQTMAEAERAIDAMLVGNTMGAAGARVVVEDCLVGEEASFIVMVDGEHVLPLASSQDHKRLRDGDEGPNTGGMGAYSPAPVVTPSVHARIMREVIVPTVAGMAAEGRRFVGFLYAGVMIDGSGVPRVLEFNCRMGDPETQPIMVRLKSDLYELFDHALDGKLDAIDAEWDRRTALGVVIAAAGYPDQPRQGDLIRGLDHVPEDVKVFHAGTRATPDGPIVSGGRVLCVTALADSVRQAQRQVYNAIANIRFDGMQYRTDIGHRAVSGRKS
ncbi:MAG TPA: phosphoribosylamine--glycine ligase [Casimicrobiaceae bacterium]|nr:phosphoribosylamine--glycine ligase [Casimicrobiaceae bacterium]